MAQSYALKNVKIMPTRMPGFNTTMSVGAEKTSRNKKRKDQRVSATMHAQETATSCVESPSGTV